MSNDRWINNLLWTRWILILGQDLRWIGELKGSSQTWLHFGQASAGLTLLQLGFFVISPHPVRASPVDWYARETKRTFRLNFYLVVHFLRCYVQEAHQSWITCGPSLKLKRQEIQSLFHFGMDWGFCDKSCFIWKLEKRHSLFLRKHCQHLQSIFWGLVWWLFHYYL